MKRGFFSHSELSVRRNTESIIPRCGLCGLYKTCQAPRMEVTGEGRRKILIIGEAPGKTEDEYVDPRTGRKGKQFIGESGQLLRDTLKDNGIHPDRDCWWDNSLRCRPPGNKLPDNDKRLMEMLEACRPNLLKTIKELQPNVIILAGGTPCKSLIPILWKPGIGKAGTWGSWRIPSQVVNAWVCPTFHPSYILRNPGPTIEKKFRQDIAAAVRLKNRPWKEVPDYLSMVERIYRPGEASKAIRKLVQDAKRMDVPIAFDYETTCLKPEYHGAEIISCSMSNGRWTIAYPWTGSTVADTDEVLRHPIRKIASNMKFEDRWTRKHLGHPVAGWYWDTMLAAHVLDNREEITSVKFQSFVLLGVKAYDEHVEKYLKSFDTSHLNRIKELDLKDLLLYNGMDALVEFLVARKQIKLLDQMKATQ